MIVQIEENEKRIKVIDDGIGIEKQEINNIFNAFYTTKQVGKGVGLGLYIVKDLILKMGWDIVVGSKISKGSIFTLIVK